MRDTLAVVTLLALLSPTPASAQRVPDRGAAARAAAANEATTRWLALAPGERTQRRLIGAATGEFVGVIAGGSVLLLGSGRSGSGDGAVPAMAILAAATSSFGVAVGASSPGGSGHGRCNLENRQWRAFGGAFVGLAAGALFASRVGARGDNVGPPVVMQVIAVPAMQIAGTLVALGNC